MIVVSDDQPDQVLEALEHAGPVAVVSAARPVPVSIRPPPVGTWLVAFTSGSTARPRAVCRTRQSWLASVAPLAELTGTTSTSRVLVPGPLASTLFLHAAWHARQVGAEPVLARLRTTEAWDVAHLVPHQLDRLLEGTRDLSGRAVVVAGAALPETTARRAVSRGLRVLAYYGASELSFVAIGRAPGPMRAFPGVAVQERAGVLWVRSPYTSLGYLPTGSDLLTEPDQPPGPLQSDLDGWCTVGDRGSVLPDGTVAVHGRGIAAVQTGGATVPVADVEAVLRVAPGVDEVVVAGVRHAALGQVVGAVVQGSGVSVQALRAFAADRLAPEARPRRWRVVASLPRTPAGKLDRVATIRLLDEADPRTLDR